MGTTTRNALACLALIGVTLAVYAPVAGHEFQKFDTLDYVVHNEVVRGGLTLDGLRWAFTEFHVANWHPLTWMSHMLDVELFGVDAPGAAGAHHMVSVVLHALSAALLFLVFARASGDFWPSLFVASVFALHPLQVESVAWVAERKNVLSTFFGFGALLAWVRYTEAPGGGRYLVTFVLVGLGLMAKSLVVTVPCLMLLLDFWPLRRTATVPPGRLLVEKLPLFGLVLAVCVLTLAAQKSGGALHTTSTYPLGMRLENAALAYARYVLLTFWPTDLAVWYPHPRQAIATWAWVGSAAALAAITAAALRSARRAPQLTVGWLWFVGTLVPMIGIVQVGGQSHADRYVYLSQTGLAVMLAWGAARSIGGRSALRPIVAALSAIVVVAMALATRTQLALWKDTATLFQHAARVTNRNYVAHNVLGLLEIDAGRMAAGIAQFRMALHFAPTFEEGHNNLGRALMDAGEYDEARLHFERGLALFPKSADGYHQLAILHGIQGDGVEAQRLFRQVLELEPENGKAHFNLGLELERTGEHEQALASFRAALDVGFQPAKARIQAALQLMKLGRSDEATSELESALRDEPENADAHYWLAGLHALARRDGEAIAEYQRSLELQPERAAAMSDLAFLLATSADERLRDPQRALQLAERVSGMSDGEDPNFLDTLAACQAATGRFEQAATTARRAHELARASGRNSLAVRIEARIALYERGVPYRAE